MWEISNNSQIINLLYSSVFGILICLIYDILRSLRCVVKFRKFLVFLQDIFFFVLLAITIFCFLLVTTNGEPRSYINLGITFGFFICRLTFSRVFFIALRFIFTKIFRFFYIIKVKFFKISKKLLYLYKKSSFLFKKLLKKEL